jgi:putative hydrolase of the HAD superfamily
VKPFLFFDVGGTLLHYRPSFAAALAEAARPLGVVVDEPSCESALDAARSAAGEGPDAVDLAENLRWWTAFFAEFARRVGCEDCGAATEALVEMHREGALQRPAPDTIPTLEALVTAGHRLGIISNWDDTLVPILRRHDIAGFFDVVVVSSEVGVAKPHPAIFRAALEAAGVAPEAAVLVGDDAETDLAGARAAGIRPVMLARRDRDDAAPGVETITSLAEILALPEIG